MPGPCRNPLTDFLDEGETLLSPHTRCLHCYGHKEESILEEGVFSPLGIFSLVGSRALVAYCIREIAGSKSICTRVVPNKRLPPRPRDERHAVWFLAVLARTSGWFSDAGDFGGSEGSGNDIVGVRVARLTTTTTSTREAMVASRSDLHPTWTLVGLANIAPQAKGDGDTKRLVG